MQKQRLAHFYREIYLRFEPFLLVGVRRVIAVEVQAAFADRHHLRMLREHAQRRNGRGIALAGVVRVDACRGAQGLRVIVRGLQRMQAFGFVPAPSTPEEHDRIVRSEIESYSRIVKLAGLRAQ